MDASATQHATTRGLQGHRQRRHSGRLCVGAGTGEVCLYLLDGELVGASAGDDAPAILEQLLRRRRFPPATQDALERAAEEGLAALLSALLDHQPDAVPEDLLHARFQENLSRFLGNPGQPRFLETTALWTPNLAMGHDSDALIQGALDRWRLARSLDDAVALCAASDALPPALQRLLSEGPQLPAALVQQLGAEPIATRAVIARWVAEGLLTPAQTPSAQPTDASTRTSMLVGRADLDAFADEGSAREEAGGFVTHKQHLDRVEVVDLSGLDPLSASRSSSRASQSGRSGRFVAPVLRTEDARSKIAVANDVLKAIARALHTHTQDNPLPRLQLLIDGHPRGFSALFEGVSVQPNGGLPVDDLVARVQTRPEAEQRRLLHQGLLDLLDRALDRASDDLPEHAFDAVLGQVSGYRQRLGL